MSRCSCSHKDLYFFSHLAHLEVGVPGHVILGQVPGCTLTQRLHLTILAAIGTGLTASPQVARHASAHVWTVAYATAMPALILVGGSLSSVPYITERSWRICQGYSRRPLKNPCVTDRCEVISSKLKISIDRHEMTSISEGGVIFMQPV